MDRKGIALAGNILVDIVKSIETYPEIGMLTSINSVDRSVGGCVPNTAIDLAKIDSTLPLIAFGCVGNDEYGEYVISTMKNVGIDVSKVVVSNKASTSFSDVMSLKNGERTFFHYRGCNAAFSPSDINLASLNSKILHIGYIMLLDLFDMPDDEYGTAMARFLMKAKKSGIITSVDVVSDSRCIYSQKIIPVLPFLNYLIINEIEACKTFNVSPYKDNGTLDDNAIRSVMYKFSNGGVSDAVIVHSKEKSYLLNCVTEEFLCISSLEVPDDIIKGSVGAGDAYCAGCLYGIYNCFADREILEFASAVAACSLLSETSVGGMKNKEEIIQFSKLYNRKNI